MTLALACLSPEVKLELVTTVAGNVPLRLTTANALAVLAAADREDVTVAAGAERGLVYAKPTHPAVHGVTGLGGVVLRAPEGRPSRHHAVDELAALLDRSDPHTITIVAIGPLTNIALLLALHPRLAARAARLVIMGGSVGPGNVTPAAEYNVWADPEAAARVFDSRLEIWLAQLQATQRATLDARSHEAIAASPLGHRLMAMMDGYDEGVGVNPALHDVVALAAVIDPSLVRTRRALVEVVTDRGAQRGKTLIELDSGGDAGARTAEVIVDVDVQRLRMLLAQRLARTSD